MGDRALRGLATLLAALACLGLPLAVTCTWLRLQVQDTDHYVSAVTPLADDPAVRSAVAAAVDLQLRKHGAEAASPVVRAALQRILQSPGFEPIWVAGNRTAHTELIAVLSDDGSKQGDVDIGLDPLAGTLGGSLGAKAAIDLHLVSSQDLRHARAGYRVFDGIWLWPDVALGVLVALALAVPRSRRRVVTVLSVGSLLGLGLMAGVMLVTRSQIGALGSRAHGRLVAAFWDALTHSLWIGMAAIAVVAVVALLGRLAVGVVRPT